jgi:hypothetical protein
MVTHSSTIVKALTALLIFIAVGCVKQSSTPLSPATQAVESTGTISGVIKDAWTAVPVKGAIISLAYNGGVTSVTSDASGAFSFSNVPVENIDDNNKPFVARAQYTLTVSLVDYNKAQTDSTKRYRNYYYDTVIVSYSSVRNDTTGIYGLVGTTVVNVAQLNTTLTGTVVNANLQPVANAIVYLFDESITPGVIIGQTTSGADGTYTFKQVDNGITVNISAINSDGTLRGALSTFYALASNRTSYTLNLLTATEVIKLSTANTVAPFVYQITPSNDADVASGTAIVYSFTAPIKQTPYVRTDLGLGYSTILDDIVFTYIGLKKDAGATTFTAAWNSTYTTLTITPTSIVSSAKYSINIATVLGKLTDNAGLAVVNNTSLTGDFETLYFTITGNTTVSAAPALTRRMIPGVFSTLDYNGGIVGLEWTSVANARSYNLYRSVNGGSYELYRTDIYNLQDTVSTGPLVFPIGTNNPMSAVAVNFKVTAVSKDLVEGTASNVITVSDGVSPVINSAVSTIVASKTINIYFSEPLVLSSAEAVANYQLKDTATVTPPVIFTISQASYLGYTTSGYRVLLSVSASSTALPAHTFLTVSQSVTDLNGNAMDTTSSKNKYTF